MDDLRVALQLGHAIINVHRSPCTGSFCASPVSRRATVTPSSNAAYLPERASVLVVRHRCLINSEGFQHEHLYPPHYDFPWVLLPGSEEPTAIEGRLESPHRTVERRAKTEGWISFNGLGEGIVPYRFIFRFEIYDPGETSRWVRPYETLELVLPSLEPGPMQELPY